MRHWERSDQTSSGLLQEIVIFNVYKRTLLLFVSLIEESFWTHFLPSFLYINLHFSICVSLITKRFPVTFLYFAFILKKNFFSKYHCYHSKLDWIQAVPIFLSGSFAVGVIAYSTERYWSRGSEDKDTRYWLRAF